MLMTSAVGNIQKGKSSMSVDANRAYMLWANTNTKLADAIERVCIGQPDAYKATVMVLCELKYMNQ